MLSLVNYTIIITIILPTSLALPNGTLVECLPRVATDKKGRVKPVGGSTYVHCTCRIIRQYIVHQRRSTYVESLSISLMCYTVLMLIFDDIVFFSCIILVREDCGISLVSVTRSNGRRWRRRRITGNGRGTLQLVIMRFIYVYEYTLCSMCLFQVNVVVLF